MGQKNKQQKSKGGQFSLNSSKSKRDTYNELPVDYSMLNLEIGEDEFGVVARSVVDAPTLYTQMERLNEFRGKLKRRTSESAVRNISCTLCFTQNRRLCLQQLLSYYWHSC
jgi:hypothetical protein